MYLNQGPVVGLSSIFHTAGTVSHITKTLTPSDLIPALQARRFLEIFGGPT